MVKEKEQIARKLAAILSTDVKGYSRLMGDDEVATVETITRYRKLIGRLVEVHHGRVVDSPGDNLLAEFASAVHALDCAVNIQERLAVTELEPYLDDYPSYLPLQRTLAYSYCQVGEMKKAKQTANHVMHSDPGFNADVFARKLPFNDPTVRNQFIDTLKRAGFPWSS